MIVYVSEKSYRTVDNVIMGVSTEWRTAMQRLMDTTGFDEYKQCRKITETMWEVVLPNDSVVGYITKVELDKPLS